MLFAYKERVYLVDKLFNFYSVKGLKLPSADNLQKAQNKVNFTSLFVLCFLTVFLQTILDGQLIFNHYYSRAVYMIFDVICVDGIRVAENTLTQRLEVIRFAFYNNITTSILRLY